jgi:hypothetical protein
MSRILRITNLTLGSYLPFVPCWYGKASSNEGSVIFSDGKEYTFTALLASGVPMGVIVLWAEHGRNGMVEVHSPKRAFAVLEYLREHHPEAAAFPAPMPTGHAATPAPDMRETLRNLMRAVSNLLDAPEFELELEPETSEAVGNAYNALNAAHDFLANI